MKKLALSLAFISSATFAAVPNTFITGTPAVAADVNQNFSYLDSRISAVTLTVRNITATSQTGVVSAMCAAGETLAGGGCVCNGWPSSYESGYLFACKANNANNGFVGGCYDMYSGQTVIPIEVTAHCAKVGEPTTAKDAYVAPSQEEENTLRRIIEQHRGMKP